MKVVKRDGSLEECHFDTITDRLKELSHDLCISADRVAQKICASITDGIHTTELDQLASETAIGMLTDHPDYATLAARIVVSDLHKKTSSDFVQVFQRMRENTANGEPAPLVTEEVVEIAKAHRDILTQVVDYAADYEYDYFGIKTLIKSYLTKMEGEIVERPQVMLLRVAIGIWANDIDTVVQTYKLLSQKMYTHATPTLYNAGTLKPQLSSCFLVSMSDSVDNIFDTIKQCAKISKHAGGIGLHLHEIRAKGSYIKGTNGQSAGILPLLRTLNNVARYIDQGGRRPGSIAVYLSPDHPDIMDFLRAKLPTGNEEERARDL